MSILQMSISAGALVIVIVLIRAVALNRLPKKMFLALWGVALFRLLLPLSIPLPFSVQSIFSEAAKTVLTDTAMPPVMDYQRNTAEVEVGQSAEAVQAHSFIAPITIIWLLGMLAAFIICAILYYRDHKRLRFAMVIRDNDYLNEWLANHRLLRPITIMQSDRILSPLAVGIIKPRIILPNAINMSDKQLLDFVLTHEYFHMKRHDAVWKVLLLIALCVHWFNPMVWLMFLLAGRDLELTCDEAVIRRFGATAKKAYAYMLIGMAEQGCKFAPLYNGFSRNAIEERIVSIMKSKKLPLTRIVFAFALVSLLTVGVFAASAANAQASDGNSGKTIIEKSETLINENGDEQPVDGQIYQAGRFMLKDDGTFTPSHNGEALPEDLNDYPFSIGDELLDSNSVASFQAIDAADPYDLSEAHSKVMQQIMQQAENLTPRTYTDEEMAQIIADIESGKIQPYTPKEGESVFFYDGENTIPMEELSF